MTSSLPVTIPDASHYSFNLTFKPTEVTSYTDVLTLFFDRGDTLRIANQIRITGGGIPVGGTAPRPQGTKFKLYPNPTSTISEITLHGNEIIETIELLNLRGELIRSFTVNATSFILQKEGISEGTYLLRISGEKNRYQGKWIVK
jgi:hypothetical protein